MRAVFSQFSGPYSPARPAKIQLKLFLLPKGYVIYRQNFLAYLARKGVKPSFTLNCVLKRANDLNMVSAQHSSNNGKN